MILLSPHFSLEEMTVSDIAVRRGLDNTPNLEEIAHLRVNAAGMERVREILHDSTILVNSAFRSRQVNAAIGSSNTSDHPKGWATDFICPSFGSPYKVSEALRDSDLLFDQLIYEGTWTHISFNPRLRRQVVTAIFRKGQPTTYIPGIISRT